MESYVSKNLVGWLKTNILGLFCCELQDNAFGFYERSLTLIKEAEKQSNYKDSELYETMKEGKRRVEERIKDLKKKKKQEDKGDIVLDGSENKVSSITYLYGYVLSAWWWDKNASE